jgi:RNA recognition motif-containing protein
MSKKVYVGNISFKTTEEDIKQMFLDFGDIESINMITDSQTGRPKGFCFVEMSSEEEAAKAIKALNETKFMNRTIRVSEAKPKRRENNNHRSRKNSFDRKKYFSDKKGIFKEKKHYGRVN